MKYIIKNDCMKNGYVCENYPAEEAGEIIDGEIVPMKFNPDTVKICERGQPECFYCNRCKDKEKKDRYK